jgi:hypothetical protein
VTADNKSKTYGDDNPALTATVTGTSNGDTLNYTLATTATKFSNVGNYPITVTLGSNPNYNVSKTDGTLTINQKLATVTRTTSSRRTGTTIPPLTATVLGQVVGGDVINYTLATTATKFSNVGVPDHRDAWKQPELQRLDDGRHVVDRPEVGVGDGGQQVEDLWG